MLDFPKSYRLLQQCSPSSASSHGAVSEATGTRRVICYGSLGPDKTHAALFFPCIIRRAPWRIRPQHFCATSGKCRGERCCDADCRPRRQQACRGSHCDDRRSAVAGTPGRRSALAWPDSLSSQPCAHSRGRDDARDAGAASLGRCACTRDVQLWSDAVPASARLFRRECANTDRAFVRGWLRRPYGSVRGLRPYGSARRCACSGLGGGYHI